MGYAVEAYPPTDICRILPVLSPAVLPIGNLSRQSPDLIIRVCRGAWKPNPEVAMQHADDPAGCASHHCTHSSPPLAETGPRKKK